MKPKLKLNGNLPIDVLREGNAFIAYCPVLDLPAAGKTYEDALKKFDLICAAFVEEMAKAGTLENYLAEMGWAKSRKEWIPPVLVGHSEKPFTSVV
ncbi:MAG: hypothetical protein HY747_03410 [Elusimicrobia bacterium]|nr:hypothetical protein [Elusimicrobiota bacterium]